MTTQERAQALEPLTQYGPEYNRNVAVSIADYRLFANRGEQDAAERYLLQAEMRAGLMSFEDFQQATAAVSGQLF